MGCFAKMQREKLIITKYDYFKQYYVNSSIVATKLIFSYLIKYYRFFDIFSRVTGQNTQSPKMPKPKIPKIETVMLIK